MRILASPMACRRCVGSLRRQCCKRSTIFGGVVAAMRLQSGSSLSTAARTCDAVFPSNCWRPVSISATTTPNAQMSARQPTAELTAKSLARVWKLCNALQITTCKRRKTVVPAELECRRSCASLRPCCRGACRALRSTRRDQVRGHARAPHRSCSP